MYTARLPATCLECQRAGANPSKQIILPLEDDRFMCGLCGTTLQSQQEIALPGPVAELVGAIAKEARFSVTKAAETVPGTFAGRGLTQLLRMERLSSPLGGDVMKCSVCWSWHGTSPSGPIQRKRKRPNFEPPPLAIEIAAEQTFSLLHDQESHLPIKQTMDREGLHIGRWCEDPIEYRPGWLMIDVLLQWTPKKSEFRMWVPLESHTDGYHNGRFSPHRLPDMRLFFHRDDAAAAARSSVRQRKAKGPAYVLGIRVNPFDIGTALVEDGTLVLGRKPGEDRSLADWVESVCYRRCGINFAGRVCNLIQTMSARQVWIEPID